MIRKFHFRKEQIGFYIPKAQLEELGWSEKDQLEIEFNGMELIITKTDNIQAKLIPIANGQKLLSFPINKEEVEKKNRIQTDVIGNSLKVKFI